MISMSIRKLAIASLHVLFWVVLIALPQYWIFTASQEIPVEIIYYSLITGIYHPITFYTFFLFIVPLTFEKKIRPFYTISIYFITAITLFTLKTAIVYFLDKLTDLDFSQHELFSYKQQFTEAFNTAFFILIAILVRIAMYWYKDQKNRTELSLREHQLELELLKAQINPHFFFNTLNNIYSLVYKKSDNAPAAVMKLSEIMRYLIYESKAEMVPLEKEVEQLENYIELERLRSRDPDFVSFDIKGDITTHVVPPMILITFAENAFKHGKRRVKKPGIIISISADEGHIHYNVKNFVLLEPHNNHMGEGIGMENTRRRLRLLYPNCHKLDVKKDNEKHEVSLQLNCKLKIKEKI